MNRLTPLPNETGHDHVVQLYGDDEPKLNADVARYLAEGARGGRGVIVVATSERRAALWGELEGLGVPAAAAERAGSLRFMDAHETLEAFMVDGYPSWERFNEAVGTALVDLQKAVDGRPVCAYGEMVAVLWRRGQFPSAIRLEQLWNRLQRSIAFDLYCAYPIDIFDRQFELGVVSGLLCNHSKVVAADRDDDLARALGRVLEEMVMPQPIPQAIAGLGRGEGAILWVRRNLPACADEILRRARAYYVAG